MPRNDALSVKLSLFFYKQIDGWVNLRWRTVTESNNYGFEIQKACDDGIFERIGFVPGKGTTQQPQFYEFKDQQVELGETRRSPKLVKKFPNNLDTNKTLL